jgi:hypothetical protein
MSYANNATIQLLYSTCTVPATVRTEGEMPGNDSIHDASQHQTQLCLFLIIIQAICHAGYRGRQGLEVCSRLLHYVWHCHYYLEEYIVFVFGTQTMQPAIV